uniref:Uncharacterized protein n=1 Tax=Romanomermis culicivorax TaxID=13658 RepID=A0A915I1W7_ROMCU
MDDPEVDGWQVAKQGDLKYVWIHVSVGVKVLNMKTVLIVATIFMLAVMDPIIKSNSPYLVTACELSDLKNLTTAHFEMIDAARNKKVG